MAVTIGRLRQAAVHGTTTGTSATALAHLRSHEPIFALRALPLRKCWFAIAVPVATLAGQTVARGFDPLAAFLAEKRIIDVPANHDTASHASDSRHLQQNRQS